MLLTEAREAGGRQHHHPQRRRLPVGGGPQQLPAQRRHAEGGGAGHQQHAPGCHHIRVTFSVGTGRWCLKSWACVGNAPTGNRRAPDRGRSPSCSGTRAQTRFAAAPVSRLRCPSFCAHAGGLNDTPRIAGGRWGGEPAGAGRPQGAAVRAVERRAAADSVPGRTFSPSACSACGARSGPASAPLASSSPCQVRSSVSLRRV